MQARFNPIKIKKWRAPKKFEEIFVQKAFRQLINNGGNTNGNAE